MIIFLILVAYVVAGIILELYFNLSQRFWRLYTMLLILISFITVLDWISIFF
jgi:hypothetical protein